MRVSIPRQLLDRELRYRYANEPNCSVSWHRIQLSVIEGATLWNTQSVNRARQAVSELHGHLAALEAGRLLLTPTAYVHGSRRVPTPRS